MTAHGLVALALFLLSCGREAELVEATAAPPDDVVEPAPSWAEELASQRTLAEADARYLPRLEGDGVAIEAASLRAMLEPTGATLSIAGVPMHLVARALVRGDTRTDLDGAAPEIAGPEAHTARGAGVTEWWRALPGGLEHGLTLADRPAGEGELAIELAVDGLTPSLSGDEVTLADETGRVIARYTHLAVLDADARELPAHMAVADGAIVLALDDTAARYPLDVDPFVLAQDVSLSGPTGIDRFGYAVSITSGIGGGSPTRARVAVGAYREDSLSGEIEGGTVRIWRDDGTFWSFESNVPGANVSTGAWFGWAVDLNTAGNVAAIGAPHDDGLVTGADAGRLYVYTRTGTIWARESYNYGPQAGAEAGRAVAITGDGTRVAMGAPYFDLAGPVIDAGEVLVLQRGVGSDAAILQPSGAASDFFGSAIALSNDGARIAVGAPGDDNARGTNAGGAFVYLRTGTTWALEGTLLAPDLGMNDAHGCSVAITPDATRVVVGVCSDTTGGVMFAGSARVYLRTGVSWAYEATLTTAAPTAGGTYNDALGTSASISAAGDRVLLGAPGADVGGVNDAGIARLFLRIGTSWSEQGAFSAPDAATADTLGQSVSILDDGTVAVAGVSADNGFAGTARVIAISTAPNGTACTVSATCTSGNCVDGVCCDTACGGGSTTDCQSCSQGAVVGVCGALTVATAPTVTCRVAATLCDVAEVCVAGNTTCPTDGFAPNTTECRGIMGLCDAREYCTGTSSVCPTDAFVTGTECRAAGPGNPCDAPELCSGGSAACPADAPAPMGTSCRPAAGTCDLAEVCTGSSFTCPMDARVSAGTTCRASIGTCDVPEACTGAAACPADVVVPMGMTCRASMGSCDIAEVCNGSNGACPGDGFIPSGTVCRSSMGTCDVAEACNGGSPTCPGDGFAPSTMECRGSSGTCDVAENCTGMGVACPTDAFEPATTPCGPTPSGVCDAQDHCSGSSTACVAQFAGSSTECRASVGLCDVAETCPGNSTVCPVDDFAPGGTVCRASGGTCDRTETCTGISASCPADLHYGGAVVCRSQATECDREERCDGTNDACPVDAFEPSTTICGAPASGVCDVADRCSGTSTACVDTYASGATVCRTSTGACDVAETCPGNAAACPSDGFASAGVVCRSSAGACDVEETCSGSGAACPGDAFATSATVCRGAATECDVAETCSGSGASCPTDAFASATTTCGAAPSGDCDAADHCSGSSTACVATFLSGNTCRAAAGTCDTAEVCLGDDADCPSDGFVAAGTECRGSGGTCDVVEQCSGTDAACPTDAFLPGSVVCRPASSECDVDESCSGLGPSCPADAFASSATVCGAAPSGVCDAPDRCAGTSADCNPVFLVDVACRPAAGACDLPESCTGTAADCPSDQLVASGVTCGGSVPGSCSSAGVCDGALPNCPGATPFPDGTVCLPAIGGDPCDVDDVCDGVSDACQPSFEPAGTVCDATVADVCDAPDVCAGTSADCVPTFLVDVECRTSAGACDVAERCSGDAVECPDEGVLGAGVVCRTSTSACDTEEVCDGLTSVCPVDVDTCAVDAGSPDGGGIATDGGPGTDAGPRDGGGGSTADGGAPPIAAAGCSCRTTASPAPIAGLVGLALLVGLRRRRAR